MTDRSAYPTRKTTLAEAGGHPGIARLSATERLMMVWPLTRQAWLFKEGVEPDERLRRDVVRVVRRGG